MIDPTRLRALLSDHPPQAFHQREQAAIRDVWEFALSALLTEGPPTKDGFYWLREDDDEYWSVVRVKDGSVYWAGIEIDAPLTEISGQFFGPIPVPDTNTSPATKE